MAPNTNRLLGSYPGVVGLKTGDTPWADKVLLGVAERGPRRIVTVVMGSDDHFADTQELLDWAFATYRLRDRMLRPLYVEQGGGATISADLELSTSGPLGPWNPIAASLPDNGRFQWTVPPAAPPSTVCHLRLILSTATATTTAVSPRPFTIE